MTKFFTISLFSFFIFFSCSTYASVTLINNNYLNTSLHLARCTNNIITVNHRLDQLSKGTYRLILSKDLIEEGYNAANEYIPERTLII